MAYLKLSGNIPVENDLLISSDRGIESTGAPIFRIRALIPSDPAEVDDNSLEIMEATYSGDTVGSFGGVASLVQIRMYALVQISYVCVSPTIKIGISPNFWRCLR